jgi:hypothetical protein
MTFHTYLESEGFRKQTPHPAMPNQLLSYEKGDIKRAGARGIFVRIYVYEDGKWYPDLVGSDPSSLDEMARIHSELRLLDGYEPETI